MQPLDELGGDELLVNHPDPIALELNKLQNQLKEKDRELGVAQSEIKAMKATEVLKDKALEELGNELKKLDEKIRVTESLLEQKNLDIKKFATETKEALAAQYAAEATLRRVYADQKDEDSMPIESVIAPLEAEIRMYKNEIGALQEDKKALERLTKSKEAALLEAERILRSALERALIVEEVQNQNFELKRQIEICQEENKILDKTNHQKVLEVEKLSQTIKELEEAILAGGVAANAIRDFQRQISELHEEKRTLERELARAKVSANRVATVVANEWKDENDKVMPVKQWLEERRLMQAEMQRLRDKLTISERTAKAEGQLKEKFKLRLRTLEEGLKQMSGISMNHSAFCGSPKPEKPGNFFGILSGSGKLRKRSSSQPRASTVSRSSEQPTVENEINAVGQKSPAHSLKKKHASGEKMLRKSLWASRSKIVDSGEKENKETKENSITNVDRLYDKESEISFAIKKVGCDEACNKELQNMVGFNSVSDDMVSGFLYDKLQKVVINLRKSCEMKDSNLNAKDEEIKMLAKKIDTLMKAIELEYKKVKREAATRDKDSPWAKVEDKKKIRNTIPSKRVTKAS